MWIAFDRRSVALLGDSVFCWTCDVYCSRAAIFSCVCSSSISCEWYFAREFIARPLFVLDFCIYICWRNDIRECLSFDSCARDVGSRFGAVLCNLLRRSNNDRALALDMDWSLGWHADWNPWSRASVKFVYSWSDRRVVWRIRASRETL